MEMLILIGVASLLTLSILLALIVAAVLGRIGREVSQLLDLEPWSTAPLSREGAFATERAGKYMRTTPPPARHVARR